MSVFRRIIYHSGWFILLGPLIGAATAIGVINFYPPLLATRLIFVVFLQNNTRISDYYRLDIQSPPAWLTGVACALIPLKLYQK